MLKLSSVYVQEQNRYTQLELMRCFNMPEEKMMGIIRKLKSYGVLKSILKNNTQQSNDEYNDDFEDISDVIEGDTNHIYVFTFVGIIIIDEIVLKCYPKYINKNTDIDHELKKIIKVIERYNKNKNSPMELLNEYEENKFFNMLSSTIFLLRDYLENGLYENIYEIKEINGVGSIDWNNTINNSFAILNNGRPCYLDLVTRNKRFDNFDYFKLLHEFVVTECSKQLEEIGLIDYFDDISQVNISELSLDDFGDINFILYSIEKELNIQYNTRKQMILTIIYAYLSHHNDFTNNKMLGLYGTNSFNLVWQDVCQNVLNNQLYAPLRSLMPGQLSEKYKDRENETLIKLIDKPFWNNDSWNNGYESKKTLVPDIITINNKSDAPLFIILDAKYYNLKMEDGVIKNNPGIQDITKQYLYELAFKDFINEHKLDTRNLFLFPSEESKIVTKGYVTLKILGNLGLNKIEIKFLPANKMFNYYLDNKLLDLNKIIITDEVDM